jgi:hypothetical protein
MTSNDLPHQVARLHEEVYKDPIQKVLDAFEQCDDEQRAEALYLHLYHHEAAPKCFMGLGRTFYGPPPCMHVLITAPSILSPVPDRPLLHRRGEPSGLSPVGARREHPRCERGDEAEGTLTLMASDDI